jgi:hypothetical protein
MLDGASLATAAAVRGAVERALAAVVKLAIAISEAALALQLTAAIPAQRCRVRVLHRKLTLLLAAATMSHITRKLGLAAAPIIVAVRETWVALGHLTLARYAVRSAVLYGAATLALPAMLERVRLDLAAIDGVAIAVAIAVCAARELTNTVARHGVGMWQLAASSCITISRVWVVPRSQSRGAVLLVTRTAAGVRASSRIEPLFLTGFSGVVI